MAEYYEEVDGDFSADFGYQFIQNVLLNGVDMNELEEEPQEKTENAGSIVSTSDGTAVTDQDPCLEDLLQQLRDSIMHCEITYARTSAFNLTHTSSENPVWKLARSARFKTDYGYQTSEYGKEY